MRTTQAGGLWVNDAKIKKLKNNSGTNRYFNKVVARFGIDIDMVDPINLELFESKVRPNTAVCMSSPH